jgi:hypothetical protein
MTSVYQARKPCFLDLRIACHFHENDLACRLSESHDGFRVEPETHQRRDNRNA